MRLVRPPLVAFVAALAGAAPASATAPTLATTTGCYQEGADVVMTGTGFFPGSFVAVSQDGQYLGLGLTNPQGVFRNKLVAPTATGTRERVHELVATDAASAAITATVGFRTTDVFATFSPGAGNLGTLRVRFRVGGFGLFKNHAKVYVHYVRPNGKARMTVYLGKARGTCGHIHRTRRRLLFPFAAEHGVWKLQFDTRAHYGKGSGKSKFAWVRRTVRVGQPGG